MSDNTKSAEQIVKDMNEAAELSKAEEFIRDNKITFDYNDKKYRVRLLNLKEKEELDTLRRKKFGQLMKDKDILLEKDLIQQYKERGINIDELDDEMKKINAEETALQLKLGESISKNEGETILNELHQQISQLRIQRQVLSARKTLYLEYSLENQFLNYVAQIITYLSAEKLEEGVWSKMFNSLDEFQNYSDEELINRLGQYSMLLQYLI